MDKNEDLKFLQKDADDMKSSKPFGKWH
jgi:hypothetical protein